MEQIFEVSLLLDFYGQMLTERQQEIMDLHYNSDFSLGEIAEQMNISRQGVHDNIRRGKNTLYELEEKLGLVKRFQEQKGSIEEIIANLDIIMKKYYGRENPIENRELSGELENIKSIAQKILGEI